MVRRYLLICLFTITFSGAQPLTERYSQFGTILVPQFPSAPFPHPLRSAGHTYGKTVFPAEKHYSDSSVAIFIPKGFKPGKAIDLVVYFHGWNNSIDSACMQFSLIEQFVESKKNAIFVFPEGPKYSSDSFGGRMEEKDGLKNLVNDVLKELRAKKLIGKQTIGRIILAGHSGAYRVIAFCLMRGGLTKNVSDVILFDALYGETEKYAYWIDHFSGRLVNIYTDGGGTKGESESLMADLDGWGMKYFQAEESAVHIDDLRNNRLIFIHTDLTHNDVIAVRRQFREYLMTSKLQQMR